MRDFTEVAGSAADKKWEVGGRKWDGGKAYSTSYRHLLHPNKQGDIYYACRKIFKAHCRDFHHSVPRACQSSLGILAAVYSIRWVEPVPVFFHQLVSHDDVFKVVRGEKL